MNIVFASLFFCLVCSWVRPSNSQCTTTGYMKSCSLQSRAETLQVFGDELLVGTANALLSYGLDLQQTVAVDLTSNNATLQSCVDDSFSPESCRNFIKVIEPIPGSDIILVCGTNSYLPKCTLHNKYKLTNFSTLSSVSIEDKGYSPHSDKDFIVSLVTSNKRFFSATRFVLNGALTTIGMSPNPLLGDNRFTVRVSASTDDKQLNLPIQYISAHEYGEYVYFFVTESALELTREVNDMTSKPQYTRAIRMCKTDDGIGQLNPELNRFLTFQKARMECKVGKNANSDLPYYYDNLKSTFIGSEGESPVLYGTFNSQSNGPKGGAICKFSFSPNQPGSLTHVFEDGNYNVRTVESSHYVWAKESGVSQFTCDTPRTTEEASKYELVYNPVSSDKPLFVTDGEFLDKIAAETVTYNEDIQEVLYYSNQLGQIKQVVVSSSNPGKNFIHNIVMEPDTNELGDIEEVRKLILRSETNGARSLYVSRGKKIIQIYRGHCDQYTDCQNCLEAQDPYCGWQSTTMACVNKLTLSSSASLTQSFSASKSDIIGVCNIPTDTPVFTNLPHSSPASNSGPTSTNGYSLPTQEELMPSPFSKKVSISVIIGVSAGAFVAGLLVGLAVCCIFLCTKCKKRTFSTRKSYDVQDSGAGTTNHTTNANIEPVQSKRITLDNSGSMVPDRNPSPTKVNLALKPTPPPRYIEHALPLPQASQPLSFPVSPLTINNGIAGGSSHFSPNHTRSNGKEANKFNFTIGDDDSAFRDTVPPLKSFPSTSSMHDSLKGHKYGGGSNGITRKQVPNHPIPRGRTNSTVWLRELSISSEISPLQSPISDV